MTHRLRATLAGLAGLAGAGYFLASLPSGRQTAALIPPAALLIAAVAVHLPALGAQLLARGLWWSNLVLGLLLTFFGSRNEGRLGVGFTVACGAALVLADRRVLTAAADTAGFRPAAYGATLQLLLVLALADAQTLVLFAAVEAQRPGPTTALFLLVACGLLAGFVGLLRLALWGVGLTMASSLVLGVALATQSVRVDRELFLPLLAIAALQVVIPLPMLASMALKRPLPEAPLRIRARLAEVVVGALVLATVAAWQLGFRLR